MTVCLASVENPRAGAIIYIYITNTSPVQVTIVITGTVIV
jgi:hypothetical protein